MGMMINRRMEYGGKSLPYDAEIEYLEGMGAQSIYFGDDLMSTAQYKINVIISPTILYGVFNRDYLGIMGSNGSPQIGWTNGGWTTGNTGSQVPYIPVVGNKYNIEFSKNLDGSYWVDGVDTGLRRTGSIPKRIFWIQSGMTNAKCKLYGLKILNSNDEVVYDFIPVRVGNVGYLYDKVSGQLFGNAGTDDFILGPDK